ncbi:hypothetical protein ACFQZE_06325 [Paenibacillus sp. GCM10027627]|uniref:hypothetical protein n=1 Tax=unclassified Paenibacillus TaxID=185978 RepID=UPI003644236F
MLTEFGKFVRKLRIDNDELLKHMANKLEVSSSYLSAVEIGKCNLPDEWKEVIINSYKLDNKSSDEILRIFGRRGDTDKKCN